MITPQNKAVIFSRYLGADIIIRKGTTIKDHEGYGIGEIAKNGGVVGAKIVIQYIAEEKYDNYNQAVLLLAPLHLISRDEMEIIMRMKYGEMPASYEYTVEALEQGSKVIIDAILTGLPVYQSIVDFLRLRHYATSQTVIENGKPVTYSVEQLVAEGVYELKEK